MRYVSPFEVVNRGSEGDTLVVYYGDSLHNTMDVRSRIHLVELGITRAMSTWNERAI